MRYDELPVALRDPLPALLAVEVDDHWDAPAGAAASGANHRRLTARDLCRSTDEAGELAFIAGYDATSDTLVLALGAAIAVQIAGRGGSPGCARCCGLAIRFVSTAAAGDRARLVTIGPGWTRVSTVLG